MIKVKVCGLTDPRNIMSVAEAGADYLGFIFYRGSKRYAANLRPKDLQLLPASIIKTGVFVNEKLGVLLETAAFFNLDLIQLHGDEDLEYCKKIKNEGYKIVRSLAISDAESFNAINTYSDFCDFLLFDTKSTGRGGTGKKFNWNLLHERKIPLPFFLSGGISPGDAQNIHSIKNNNLWAADLNSLFETEPGIKDSSRVREFINELKK